MAEKNKDKKPGPETLPPAPECCGKTMAINQRFNRVSGPRIVYRCTGKCGGTKTVKL